MNDVVEEEITTVEEGVEAIMQDQSDVDKIAVVQGQSLFQLPDDLYIPPDALEVFLEAFEGPLDLLLYLIKRQNLDVLDIPIAEIPRQYMEYVDLMKELRLELAAEYLVMAASLAEIKSRMLLPRPEADEDDEHDPRAELIRRLQEYERFKKAAQDIDELERLERDNFIAYAEPPPMDKVKPLPETDLRELLMSLKDVLRRTELQTSHHIQKEALSLRERMSNVLATVNERGYCEFSQLFSIEEGRAGVVVTFSAILELLKQATIEIIQNEPYSPIHIKAVS